MYLPAALMVSVDLNRVIFHESGLIESNSRSRRTAATNSCSYRLNGRKVDLPHASQTLHADGASLPQKFLRKHHHFAGQSQSHSKNWSLDTALRIAYNGRIGGLAFFRCFVSGSRPASVFAQFSKHAPDAFSGRVSIERIPRMRVSTHRNKTQWRLNFIKAEHQDCIG